MNFSFSDDQILLRNSVRGALDEQCKPPIDRSLATMRAWVPWPSFSPSISN